MADNECQQVLGLRVQGFKLTAAAGATENDTEILQTGRGFIYGLRITSPTPIADADLASLSVTFNGQNIIDAASVAPFSIVSSSDRSCAFVQAQSPGGVKLSVTLDNSAGANPCSINVEPLYAQDKRLLIKDFIANQTQ